ncbi:MAG: hypothetical protein ACO37D_12230 [Rhodothermales bacterium]|jgi:DNA-binding transcriptional regulator PaaX
MALSHSLKDILNRLIFTESWHDLLAETGMHEGALRADLSWLISNGYVQVFALDRKTSLSPFFDLDRMDAFMYRATHTGLHAIQHHHEVQR